MTNRLWVLGADDPEMSAIEALLTECGEQIVHATVNGQRVHPGNAYRADLPIADQAYTHLYYVECAAHEIRMHHYSSIDHHRPGDPGYGMPPAEFLRGSSLGQVIAELARLDIALDELPGWEPVSCFAGEESDAHWFSIDPPGFFGSSGRLRLSGERHTASWSGARWVRPPQTILFAAAADHCLGAAYRGECSGVDVEAFGEWRLATRAAFQGRSIDEVRADVKRAVFALRSAPAVALLSISNMSHTCDHDWSRSVCDGCNREEIYVQDLRGEEIPELPEAACRLGVAYLATSKPGPDGRRKVVLQCATAEHLAAWPAWAEANGIVDCYGGDPARGFAGGYLVS